MKYVKLPKTDLTVLHIALSVYQSLYDFTGIPIIFSRTHEQFEDSLSAGGYNPYAGYG